MNKKMINVYFDTLGCAKNLTDTNKMLEILSSKNICIVNNVENSDVIIVNTCAFIEAAAQESINTILEYKKFYSDKKIIVTGCLVSRYKNDLINSLNEADDFLACEKESEIYNTIKKFFPNYNYGNTVVNKSTDKYIINKTFAYVKISEGCNKFCSYCMIPYIRGRYFSIPYEQIKNDIEKYTNSGIKEIILVAQDCGVWGSDFQTKLSLSWLLDKLANDFNNIYFRILYIQPDEINSQLLNTIKKHDNIINYLDIPLQHSNKDILKRMNRKGSTKQFLSLISTIRKIIPNCTLRTTLMCGFPGETEENFDELMSFINLANLDYVGVFKYSDEEGTKASKLNDQIPENIKDKRLNLLVELIDNISLQKLEEKVGKKVSILIEGIEENRVYGRASFQAPDVDGYVYIENVSSFSDNIYIGKEIKVEIINTELYDLVGKLKDNEKK